jgi:hypothetical protein
MTKSATKSRPRLFADFHNADSQGRLRLNCSGTAQDLDKTGVRLENGLEIVVYSEELEADARVFFANDEALWVAEIDWNKIRRGSGE